MSEPHENPAFVGDDGKTNTEKNINTKSLTPSFQDNDLKEQKNAEATPERDNWGKGVEFLMSCIAMSVGLGNVWRFPFTALENGGGAFLIPYLIVLFLVGKPIYYLEMIIGQFSSRGSVKVFDLCPALRGIGIGQVYIVFFLGTYYQSICALISYYLVQSFRSPLPWSYCREEWGANCIDSTPRTWFTGFDGNQNLISSSNLTKADDDRVISSSELYFVNIVLRELPNINDGIGTPNWDLTLGLFVSWVFVFLITMRGVKSSGKAAYFLAIFPYLVMAVVLVRAVTLPGSVDGIIFFIKPEWSKILEPQVWYAAVTQCFYSLAVCFGNIIMYSSYNRFDHNIYRDASIVTALDTCTSLLAGFTIFGILGHLAHEIGTDDIGSVVKGGAGLAFISYPDAIAKFKKVPQIFSVLFFLMLFVLGIGSDVAITSCAATAIRDRFPKFKQWQVALVLSVISFAIGLMYVTPGGQFMLTLVDHYCAAMVALILGIAELLLLGWIYGVHRLTLDVQFMSKRKVGIYWRLCWSLVTPLIMSFILIYFLATYEKLEYNNVTFPTWAYAMGWTISSIGIAQLPIWMCVAIIRQPGDSFMEKVRGAFRPTADWGPLDPMLREQYNKKIEEYEIASKHLSSWAKIKRNIWS